MENEKLLSLDELLRRLDQLKKEGKKIVFTNGCFDILHKGHVAYLQAAKRLGDVLVLGLNSDRSVRALKGAERPLNNELDRAFVLAGLFSVDYLLVFDEDTPYEVLSKIKPHILVKGSDYKLEDVVGSEFARETVLIDFVKGYSTTSLISRMK